MMVRKAQTDPSPNNFGTNSGTHLCAMFWTPCISYVVWYCINSCHAMFCHALLWSGLVWRGLVWIGVGLRGVAWCGMAWRQVAWQYVSWRGVSWRVVVYCVDATLRSASCRITRLYTSMYIFTSTHLQYRIPSYRVLSYRIVPTDCLTNAWRARACGGVSEHSRSRAISAARPRACAHARKTCIHYTRIHACKTVVFLRIICWLFVVLHRFLTCIATYSSPRVGLFGARPRARFEAASGGSTPNIYTGILLFFVAEHTSSGLLNHSRDDTKHFFQPAGL